MIVVYLLCIFGVVHPQLTDILTLEEAIHDLSLVRAVVAHGLEVHFPARVFHFALFIGLEWGLGDVVASHIVVGVVTGDGHEGCAVDAALADACFDHSLANEGLEIVLHVDCTDVVVLVDLLERLFQLRVTDVCLVDIV